MFDNDLLHLVSYMAAAGAFLFILLSLGQLIPTTRELNLILFLSSQHPDCCTSQRS
jgi:hypothetical protein